MALDRRLQVLIDLDRLERLRRESELSGAPIGAIVREAIDHRLGGGDDASRRAALRALLDEPAPAEPEPDWDALKPDMLDRRGAGGSDAPA